MSVNIKPLEDRIVVKPLEAEQTTASGLVIPDTAKEKPQEGEVLAIGPGRIDDNGNRFPLDVAFCTTCSLADTLGRRRRAVARRSPATRTPSANLKARMVVAWVCVTAAPAGDTAGPSAWLPAAG